MRHGFQGHDSAVRHPWIALAASPPPPWGAQREGLGLAVRASDKLPAETPLPRSSEWIPGEGTDGDRGSKATACPAPPSVQDDGGARAGGVLSPPRSDADLSPPAQPRHVWAGSVPENGPSSCPPAPSGAGDLGVTVCTQGRRPTASQHSCPGVCRLGTDGFAAGVYPAGRLVRELVKEITEK